MMGNDEEKPPHTPVHDVSPIDEEKTRKPSRDSSVTADHSARSASSASTARPGESSRDVEKSNEPAVIADDPSGVLADDHASLRNAVPETDTEAQRPSDREEELPPAIPRPRKERRGLFAALCIVDEVTEPKHYPRRTKWALTGVVAIASIAAPIGSNILLSSLVDIASSLHSTATVTNLSIALYIAALAIFPIFWSSFSEVLGRRSVYVISFGILTIFNVLSAVSVNMPMFLVMRILSGGASGSVQAVGAGTIADIWHVRERGNAMATYYLGPLMGPLFAPIVGGALQLRFGWRSTMWFNAIYGVVTFLLLLFCLPETIAKRKKFGIAEQAPSATPADAESLGPSLSRTTTRQSIKNTSKLVVRILNGLFVQPLSIVQYLQFPPVLVSILYACVTFGALYVLQISIQDVFSKPPYNFSTLDVGLTYIPASLGYAISALFAGKWCDHVMAREARKAGRRDANGKLIYLAEDRMRENAWTAAIVYPLALLWWGWTTQKELYWLIPCFANLFFGLGSMIVFAAVATMLTEFMPTKAASAVGLNNLCRMLTAAIGVVVAQPLLDAIGTGWTFTAIAILALLSSVCIALLIHYGPKWRIDMDKRMKEKGL